MDLPLKVLQEDWNSERRPQPETPLREAHEVLFRRSKLEKIEKDICHWGNVKINTEDLESMDEDPTIGMKLSQGNVYDVYNVFFEVITGDEHQAW